MTTFIYSATLRDGTSYVLLYATDDPVLAARYRQLGWPVQLLSPGTSTTPVTRPDGSQRQMWSFEGTRLAFEQAGSGADEKWRRQ